MELESLFSLPAHPLLVHVPVVLVPLAAVGMVLLALRPGWIRPYGPIVVVLSGLGALGAILAAGSGEALEESVEGTASRALIHDHAEAGELARTVSIVLFLLVAALVALDVVGRRRAAANSANSADPAGAAPAAGGVPRWAPTAVAAVGVLAAIGSVVTVVQAGHSGAESVWTGTEVSSGGGERDDD